MCPFLSSGAITLSCCLVASAATRPGLSTKAKPAASRIATLYSTLAAAMLGFAIFGLFSFLYLVKSLAGIDIFPGDSPLHPLYRLLVAA